MNSERLKKQQTEDAAVRADPGSGQYTGGTMEEAGFQSDVSIRPEHRALQGEVTTGEWSALFLSITFTTEYKEYVLTETI